MTFENITRLLLPREAHKTDQKPAISRDINNISGFIDPDNARVRKNRLASLSTRSEVLKKAA